MDTQNSQEEITGYTFLSALAVWVITAVIVYVIGLITMVMGAPSPPDGIPGLIAETGAIALPLLGGIYFVPMVIYIYYPEWSRWLAWLLSSASIIVPLSVLLSIRYAALARGMVAGGIGIVEGVFVAAILLIMLAIPAQVFSWRAWRFRGKSDLRYRIEAGVLAMPVLVIVFMCLYGFVVLSVVV